MAFSVRNTFTSTQEERFATPPEDTAINKIDTISANWKRVTDSKEICSIEVPYDFKEIQLSTDQILGLACTDYDPAITIIQESADSLQTIGVKSFEKYTEMLIDMYKNSNNVKSFKRINEISYDKSSTLVIFEMDVAGTHYRYNLLITQTDSHYYYCQIFCLSEYAEQLQPTISRMLSSFEVNKTHHN